MARDSNEFPTELELLILKILWESSPQTAREIRDALAGGGRELAHTSVITTLQKMVQKGQLRQLAPESGKSLRFSPKLSEKKVSRGMVGDLMNRLFDGSPEAMVMSLFDASQLDEEQLKRLRKLVNDKMRETRS